MFKSQTDKLRPCSNYKIPLYLQAPGLIEYLQGRPCGDKKLESEILNLYVDLYERNILEEQDVILISMWLKRLGSLENNNLFVTLKE